MFLSRLFSRVNGKIKNLFAPIDRKRERYSKLLEKYSSYPRYHECQLQFDDITFITPDALSALWQLQEIYLDENYKFNSLTATPLIYDCGANIGLSCIYFKKLFPRSKVKAFEADPGIITYLNKNLELNNVKDIEVINRAVWTHNNGVMFGSEKADAGSIFRNDNRLSVKSIRLKDIFETENRIDFLKLDIEGAEYEVLADCQDQIHKTDNLFIEYHSFANRPQHLGEILKILSQNNFRYFLINNHHPRSPLIERPVYLNMNLQISVYAWKNS